MNAKFFVGKPNENRPFVRHRHRWQDIKKYVLRMRTGFNWVRRHPCEQSDKIFRFNKREGMS
jgi:hypothetical protein